MKIDRLKMGSVGVIAPHGAITQAEADELTAAIETTRQPAAGRVVLDMGDVPFVDSKGLETLLDFADRQRSAGQTAKLAGLNETCREIMDLTELLGEFEVFDSVDSAVRSFL